MAITPASLQGGIVLGTAATIIYTAPASTKAVIKRGVFANYSGAAATLTVSCTRSGGATLVLIPTRSIATSATDLAPELAGFTLNAGDVLTATAGTATAINAYLSGFTVV